MRFGDRPIEQKIFLIILPLCLIPALLFLALVVVGLRLAFEHAMGLELRRGALNVATSFDDFMDRHTTQLRSLVYSQDNLASLTLRVHKADLAGAIIQLPARLTDGQPVVRIIDPGLSSLTQFFETVRLPIAKGNGSNLEIPAEGIIVEQSISRPGHVNPEGFIYYLVPGENGGLLVFVDPAERILRRFLESLPHPPDGMLVLSANLLPVEEDAPLTNQMQEAVRNILRDPQARNDYFRLKGQNRTLLLGTAESKRMKQALGTTQPTSWVFMLQYDMEVFLGPQDTLIWLAVIVSLILVLVLMAVAFLLARMLVRPLLRLRAQAESLTAGNLDAVAEVNSRDEIGQVADAFNIMAARLHSSYFSLEERLEENRLHTEHIHVLNQVTGAIIQALSLERIFELLCSDLHKITEYDAVWLALLDRDVEDLSISQIQPGGLITLFERGRIPYQRSLHGRVIATAESLYAKIGSQHSEEFFETNLLNAEGLQSFLIAPLPAREGIIGTLTIATAQADAYGPELLSIITSLANAVAVAIEQTTLFQQISHMASELERKVAERTAELQRATNKLIQTEKYFATGRMAGNLGHEINNPLAIIKNYLHMVKSQLSRAEGGRRSTDPNLEHINIIDEEVNRIARLVRQLMELHRPVEHKVQPVDINNTLDSLLVLMEESLRKRGVHVERDFDPQLPWPVASPDLIRQVLINLLRNAQDAMEEKGGVLSVRTSSISKWEDGREFQSVRIRVSDTGVGIAPEDLSQIFDPFFSTKPSEKGSGLGLCVSYGIIRIYGGAIDVETILGQGTSMIVTLPLADRDADGEPTLLLHPHPSETL